MSITWLQHISKTSHWLRSSASPSDRGRCRTACGTCLSAPLRFLSAAARLQTSAGGHMTDAVGISVQMSEFVQSTAEPRSQNLCAFTDTLLLTLNWVFASGRNFFWGIMRREELWFSSLVDSWQGEIAVYFTDFCFMLDVTCHWGSALIFMSLESTNLTTVAASVCPVSEKQSSRSLSSG